MPFATNLANSPIGGSGIASQPQQDDTLSLVNQLKDREMQDFKNKAEFMADLNIRQAARMRNVYDPSKATPNTPVNTVRGQDTPSQFPLEGSTPSGLSPQQRMDYGLKKEELDQKGKFGQEALDIKGQQEQLNQQKSDQINALKTNDLQNKLDASNRRLDLAQQGLQQKTQNDKDILAARKEYQAAVEERHQLEMQKQQQEFEDKQRQQKTEFDATNAQHEEQIKQMQQKINDAEHQNTVTSIDSSGNVKTVKKTSGDAAQTVDVIGQDGKTYTIPKDKVNDTDANGQSHWKLAGGGQDQNQDQSQEEEDQQ